MNKDFFLLFKIAQTIYFTRFHFNLSDSGDGLLIPNGASSKGSLAQQQGRAEALLVKHVIAMKDITTLGTS